MMIGSPRIPVGTVVGMNPRIIHRSKSVFGEDAESFRLARYLDASPNQLHGMNGANLAFGGPSRSCPGQHLAKTAVVKVVAAIFLHFVLEIFDDEEAKKFGGGFREESFLLIKRYGVCMCLKARTWSKFFYEQ
jgi:cytochrome P450